MVPLLKWTGTKHLSSKLQMIAPRSVKRDRAGCESRGCSTQHFSDPVILPSFPKRGEKSCSTTMAFGPANANGANTNGIRALPPCGPTRKPSVPHAACETPFRFQISIGPSPRPEPEATTFPIWRAFRRSLDRDPPSPSAGHGQPEGSPGRSDRATTGRRRRPFRTWRRRRCLLSPWPAPPSACWTCPLPA